MNAFPHLFKFNPTLTTEWGSRQKVAVNVTDKLITLLLMLILSTVFTCV